MGKEEIEKRDQQIRERKRKRSTKPFKLHKKIFQPKNILSATWNPCSTLALAKKNPQNVIFPEKNFSVVKSFYSQKYEEQLQKQFFSTRYLLLSPDYKSNFLASLDRSRYNLIYAMLKQCCSGFFNQTPAPYQPFFCNSQNLFGTKKS